MTYEPHNKYGKPDFYSSLDSKDDYTTKADETSVKINFKQFTLTQIIRDVAVAKPKTTMTLSEEARLYQVFRCLRDACNYNGKTEGSYYEKKFPFSG